MSNDEGTHNPPPTSPQTAPTPPQEPLHATVTSPTTPLANEHPSDMQNSPAKHTYPNIIIFGETGIGKSSLINMLEPEGGSRAGVSNQAHGCTFANSPYPISLEKQKYLIWDTAGLNEGQHGTMPAEDALNNLKTLVQNLEDGVNLLVYCIRGTRFRDVLRVNYDLFTGIICQRKVPVVAVITGLENEDLMDSWWDVNKEELEARGLTFEGHACVTTSRGKMKDGSFMFEEEYRESEEKIKKLLEKHCTEVPWKNNSESWILDIGVRMAAYMERYNNRTDNEREVLDNEREVLNLEGGGVQVVESSIQGGVAPHSRGSLSSFWFWLRELTTKRFWISESQPTTVIGRSSPPGMHMMEPAARVARVRYPATGSRPQIMAEPAMLDVVAS